jgi:hypothetical protein
MSIHYSLVNCILVFLKLTPSTHFSPLFNCTAQIVICHVFFDTLRIRWYTKDFSIESYHACLNIMKVGKFFKIPGQGAATLLCDLWIPSVKIFSHMKLTPSLCFLQLFNFCQLSFTNWFFNTLKICWYTKKKFNEKFSYMPKHSRGGNVFSKLMDKRLPCFYAYGYCKTIVNVSNNNNTIFTNLWILHSIYHHWFSTHDKWMAAYQKLTYSVCFPPLFNHNQYCYLPSVFQYIKYLFTY